jgi:hypothetical protein
MPQAGGQGATPTPPSGADYVPPPSAPVAETAAPAPTGQPGPVPTTRETPGPGMTAAERSPKNVLREVDRAEAETEMGKD